VGGGEELLLERLALAVPVVAACGAAGVVSGAIDRGGAVAGGLLGVAIWLGLGGRGFALLAAFVVAGAAVTRLGFQRKSALGVAQERRGRRGARHAWANAGVAALAGTAALVQGGPGVPAWALIAAGALAAASSDTFSSEIGQAYGGVPVSIVGGRRVAPGTDGAVSAVGSAAGLLGALWIGGLAWALGLTGPAGAAAVSAAGMVGNGVDSLLGATLERRGWLGNDAVNFAATAAGGAVAVLLLG
jgi:uncharacterized protein (TIGR00297 family)